MNFIVERPPFFTAGQLEQMEETAIRILEEIGIAVADAELREKLLQAGFSHNGSRLRIERQRVKEFLRDERSRSGDRFGAGPQQLSPADEPLRMGVLTYPQSVHDPETDTLVPFTCERLIEATRLLDALDIPGVPGCPVDVPAPLQPVAQYWIAATRSRLGRRPVDPKSLETLPYVAEMAAVLGHPLRQLPVYVFSPLTLGGESLHCALAFRDRLSSVGVSDMTSVGGSVPIDVGHAFAVAAAEVIGAAVLVREALDLPVSWSIRVCPADLRTMAMALGTPEDLLLMLAGAEVNAYFHGAQWYPAAGSLHTSAKLPGPQACAEKASLMTAGALLGARSFGHAGTLSLDEAFSAEQFLYDLEIRDQTQRLVAGFDAEVDAERCLQEVREGVEQGSFAGLDRTATRHREFYWYPQLFERRFLGAWESAGRPTLRQRALQQLREHLSLPGYELEAELRNPLEAICERASQQLVGCHFAAP